MVKGKGTFPDCHRPPSPGHAACKPMNTYICFLDPYRDRRTFQHSPPRSRCGPYHAELPFVVSGLGRTHREQLRDVLQGSGFQGGERVWCQCSCHGLPRDWDLHQQWPCYEEQAQRLQRHVLYLQPACRIQVVRCDSMLIRDYDSTPMCRRLFDSICFDLIC